MKAPFNASPSQRSLYLCSNLIEVAKFPEKHQKLLVELDLLGGVRQVSLGQRVGQQTSEAFQYKIKVLPLGDHKDADFHNAIFTVMILEDF